MKRIEKITGIIKLLVIQLFCVFTLHAQNTTVTSTPAASSKIFVVLDITVHDTAMYEQYRIQVEPIIEKFGGKYLVRSGGMAFDKDPDRKVVPIEGGWNPNRLIIIQWDSMEQLQKFSTSSEYRAVAQLRENSASTKSVMVKEYPH